MVMPSNLSFETLFRVEPPSRCLPLACAQRVTRPVQVWRNLAMVLVSVDVPLPWRCTYACVPDTIVQWPAKDETEIAP
jgi:hypothetical protein